MDFTKFAKLDENGNIVYPPHNDGNHMNVHVDPQWLEEHGFEEHTQEWFDEHTPPMPEPPPGVNPLSGFVNASSISRKEQEHKRKLAKLARKERQ